MKRRVGVWLQWAGLPVGIAILVALVLHERVDDMFDLIGRAGFTLLWLLPLHALPLLVDAQGWRVLLGARVPLGFLWWVAAVREAVNRLLPTVGVGGEIVGIRLARWRVADASLVSASVIVEVMVTLAVQYAFAALGLVLIVAATHTADAFRTIGLALLLSMPLPTLAVVLLRRGGVFHTIERWAGRLLGTAHPLVLGIDGKRLDDDLDALLRRGPLLLQVFCWQMAGYALGAIETWWALALFGHPPGVGAALAIEGLTQVARHAAFMVPGGLGVQEAAVVVLAQMFGVNREAALSLALVKRAREVLFGCLALLSWQVVELVRARRAARAPVPVEDAAAPAAASDGSFGVPLPAAQPPARQPVVDEAG